MDRMKKILLLFICVTIIISAIDLRLDASGRTNLDVVLSSTALAVGDIFTVTLVSEMMTVSSIACGITFDKEKLTCISITGSDPECPDEIGINKTEGNKSWTRAYVAPSVEEANDAGSVGIAFLNTEDTSYAAGEIFTATFMAEVEGETDITLYEDSDGANGYRSDSIKSVKAYIYDRSAEENANVYFDMDKKEISVGETLTVTLSSKEMTVATIVTGISFDKDKLRCVSIVGSNPEYPNEIGLIKNDGKKTWVDASIVSSVDDANNSGNVGMAIIAIEDESYMENVLFTVTLVAVAEGEALISLYEDSDGAEGFRSDSIRIDSVRIGAQKLNVSWIGADGSAFTERFVPGSVPTYTGETPVKEKSDCKVYTFAGWSTEPEGGGTKYPIGTALPALASDTVYYAYFTSTESHSYIYVNNGDGTHDQACSDCGAVAVDNEAHVYTDGKCICGLKKIVVRKTLDTIGAEVNGRVVTVTHTAACKVGYLKDGAYLVLPAGENGDGSYSFTVPDEASELLITVKGDANLDGRVTAADIARINAFILGKTMLEGDELFSGDVDLNGAITDTDIEAMKDDVLRQAAFQW